MQLCWIGKILGWVRLCSITEPNRSQLNDCSSITERSIDTAGSIMVKKFPDRTYPSKSQYVYLIKCTLKNCLSFLNLANTVLCKSNANEFRRNSWLFVAFRRNFAWNDISTKFPRIFVTPIVLIHAIFRMIIRFARWFIPNFRAIIRSSRKVAAIFRTIIRSSWKFDL